MRPEDTVGFSWIEEEVIPGFTETLHRLTPSAYNEQTRYLPESVTSMPGPMRFQVNPYMREIVDCFDEASNVREVVLKKGVQITYTTCLEAGLLYLMGHVKTLPVMYVTADKELAALRVENNIIPMINQSGLNHIIRSSDVENSRKTGKTAKQLQWVGGGYLIPFGARNADKMRSFSICAMLQDEIDAWPDTVGKDGDPLALCDDRCSAYWPRRKIFRGSTPLIAETSKIEKAYRKGDQRKYHVPCKSCGHLQELRWSTKDEVGGFKWDLDDDDALIEESVRYHCQKCGQPHYEHDKTRMFATEHGAKWVPTANPRSPGLRSYHLPALYSPFGMQPWSKCVALFLEGYDPVQKRSRDVNKLQVFYNNVLGEPFEAPSEKIDFFAVSGHRRFWYRQGQIPNKQAVQYTGSPVLQVLMTVDVHLHNLAVGVFGICRDLRVFLIEYTRIESGSDQDVCTDGSSSCWLRLREMILEREYVADDGKRYKISQTFIDSNYASNTVLTFCSQFQQNVYPLLGRDRPASYAQLKEFSQKKTQSGHTQWNIVVDHYKDRLGPVLGRPWREEHGDQPAYHFNAPYDLPDKVLKELTTETRRRKINPTHGAKSYYWHRTDGVDNELWDLLVYAHAATEIVAWRICVEHFELEVVDWARYWEYLATNRLFFAE